MRLTRRSSLAVVALAISEVCRAEAATKPARVEVPAVAPRPEDVASIDRIVKAFYEVVSGPAGQPRQWARDRTLYVSGVRFVSMSQEKDGKPVARIRSHQEYVDDSDDSLVRGGFEEREIHRVTQRFGNIAHVFSTYQTRHSAQGPVTGRGINSLQLFWDGKRWWIASAVWDDERPGSPIPRVSALGSSRARRVPSPAKPSGSAPV